MTVKCLSYYHPLSEKTISFKTSKISADKVLKNHYTTSGKTSINKGKNTYKKQVCNHKEINQL